MDLNCLIKLLLEKNIIEYAQDNCRINGEVIMSAFRFEYEEVFQKIINARFDKTKICIAKAEYDSDVFCILNIDNLEKGLIHIGNGQESFGFSKRSYGLKFFPYKTLRYLIDEDTRFYTEEDWDFNHNFIQIVDGYLEAERIENEFNKRNEVLDFLNQLP